MKDKIVENFKMPVVLLGLYIFLFIGCNTNKPGNHGVGLIKAAKGNEEIKKPKKSEEYVVEPPPFSDGIFPCTDCHKNLVPKPQKRVLVEWHDDISAMFNHDPENRWCLDCHDLNNRDSLKLASGKLLDFKESYKLCGQCHGEKLRDWKVGVHGKRTGAWNGKKQYYLCVHCHNPHSPKFKEMSPLPPPVRQEDIK